MSTSFPDIPGYRIEAELGRGGMGVVYRATRETDGKRYALKMILNGRDASFRDLARFRMEAEALSCLNHPNIVHIRDVGVWAGCPYFVMDYADRGTLRDRLRDGPQPVGWSVGVARVLATALQHAHARSMIHRDLKPANVLLLADDRPVVSDFGLVKFNGLTVDEVAATYQTMTVNPIRDELARQAREFGRGYRRDDPVDGADDRLARSAYDQLTTRTHLPLAGGVDATAAFVAEARRQRAAAPPIDLTQTGAVLGSPAYMAPEQATGQLDRIGPATDVYAVGGILYEMLTGRNPFAGVGGMLELIVAKMDPNTRVGPPSRVNPAVPPELDAVCLRCLAGAPAGRYPSAKALEGALAAVGRLPSEPAAPPPLVPAAGDASTPRADRTLSLPESPRVEQRTRTWWPLGRWFGS